MLLTKDVHGYFNLQARKALNEKLKRMIEKRKGSGEKGEGLLGALLSNEEDEGKKKMTMKLSESEIADNIIGVIFAAHDTTASVLTWLLKYLHDNPHVLHAVRVSLLFLYPLAYRCFVIVLYQILRSSINFFIILLCIVYKQIMYTYSEGTRRNPVQNT